MTWWQWALAVAVGFFALVGFLVSAFVALLLWIEWDAQRVHFKHGSGVDPREKPPEGAL